MQKKNYWKVYEKIYYVSLKKKLLSFPPPHWTVFNLISVLVQFHDLHNLELRLTIVYSTAGTFMHQHYSKTVNRVSLRGNPAHPLKKNQKVNWKSLA